MTNSNIRPEEFVVGTNSTVINYGLEEVVEDGVTTYSYYTQEYPATNQVILDKAKAKLEIKATKLKAKAELTKLTVELTGKVFDADLESRQNMADAILVSGYTGETSTVWRLTDNTEEVVTIDELKEVHKLALQKYAMTKSIGV